jgi:hypothetical protein
MNKSFDAVAFQRKVRDELGRQYWRNREEFVKELTKKGGNLKSPITVSGLQAPRAKPSRKS